MYQYTIQADNVDDLQTWGPKLLAAMKKLPGFQDVSSDQQNGGLDQLMTYDRVTRGAAGADGQFARFGALLRSSASRKFR